MCGIAGFFGRVGGGEQDLVTARHMTDCIRHRGPDDDGFHVGPGVALGMRRLSIIDLSTGHQPIHNEDGSGWVVLICRAMVSILAETAMDAGGPRRAAPARDC